MTASVTVFQQRENIPEGHRVTTTIQDSTLIPKELFVLKYDDDAYSHVAAVPDFYYPDAKDSNFSYYRVDSVVKEFPEIESALNFATGVKDRIMKIVEAYTADVDDFVGSETEVIP